MIMSYGPGLTERSLVTVRLFFLHNHGSGSCKLLIKYCWFLFKTSIDTLERSVTDRNPGGSDDELMHLEN